MKASEMLPYKHERAAEAGFTPQFPADKKTLFPVRGPPEGSGNTSLPRLTVSYSFKSFIKPQVDSAPSTNNTHSSLPQDGHPTGSQQCSGRYLVYLRCRTVIPPGLILLHRSGLSKKTETFFFFRIDDSRVEGFRKQLAELVPIITTATQAADAKKKIVQHKKQRALASADSTTSELLKTGGVNLAFTKKGLAKVGRHTLLTSKLGKVRPVYYH
jgi:hypothetical protein